MLACRSKLFHGQAAGFVELPPDQRTYKVANRRGFISQAAVGSGQMVLPGYLWCTQSLSIVRDKSVEATL